MDPGAASDRPPDPYRLAVEAIRRRVRSGRFVQGERLRVSELSDDLRLSGSPIREALSRLAGEGLIEDRRGSGYFAWRLDAVDLSGLYGLQAALLWAAAEAGGLRVVEPVSGADGDPALASGLAQTEAGLARLVRGARSPTLLEAHLRLADRLAPARQVEPLVLGDLAGEWLDLATICAAGSEAEALAWIRLYRHRREAFAVAIIAAMRTSAEARRRI